MKKQLGKIQHFAIKKVPSHMVKGSFWKICKNIAKFLGKKL
jgi:hypothetical protein